MSDKELKKAIDSIQPGSCFGHYENAARECKTCFVVEQCSKNTAGKKLAEASVEPEKIKKKKPTNSVKKKYVKRKEDIKLAEEAEVKKEVVKAEVKKDVVKAEVKKEVVKAEVKKDVVKAEVKEDVAKAEVKEDVAKAEVKEDVAKAEVKEDVAKAEVVTEVEVELAGDSLVDAIIEKVGKAVSMNWNTSTDKSIFYYFDENKMVVTYMKASGNIQLKKNGEKKAYSKLKSEEDAKALEDAMLVGYED